jgi:hypothetical protein
MFEQSSECFTRCAALLTWSQTQGAVQKKNAESINSLGSGHVRKYIWYKHRPEDQRQCGSFVTTLRPALCVRPDQVLVRLHREKRRWYTPKQSSAPSKTSQRAPQLMCIVLQPLVITANNAVRKSERSSTTPCQDWRAPLHR